MSFEIKEVPTNVVVPAGTRLFKLVAIRPYKTKKRIWSVVNGEKTATVTDEDEDMVSFDFRHDHPQLGAVYTSRGVRPTNGQNGNLVKLAKILSNNSLTDEIIASGPALKQFCHDLINRDFFIATEPDKKQGKYNNITSIVVAPEGFSSSTNVKPAPIKTLAPVTSDDDDIPF